MSSSESPAEGRSASFVSRVALATTTLLVAIASHAVRETARDSLFLGGLPAEKLPYAYLAIAVGAIGIGVVNRALLERYSHRRLLVATLVFAVLVDVVFWTFTDRPSGGTLFGLYAWTGLLGTAVTMHLWLHLADVFDVGESKRAFPLVAAGGLAGAVLGSVLAGALLFFVDTRSLLLASAALLVVAGFAASALPVRAGDAEEEPDADADGTWEALRGSYPLRILVLAISISVLATGIDFLFKDTVSSTIPTEQLGAFFAWFHAGVNAFALIFEVALASWALRHFGVARTLMILPGALLVATQCFVAMPSLLAAVAYKFVDGTLRPSLHQAGTEVLFQPLSPQSRNAVKTASESLGKRGGQALASLAILGASGLQLDPRWIALGLAPIAGVSLLATLRLRDDYVGRFRERLSGLAAEARMRLPRLDLHSLEALVANLSSTDDAEVLAAIELLERYRRTSLIPPLLLHHPSNPVVLRALETLRAGHHPYLDDLLRRLLEHSDAEVRAAALNALIARGARDVPVERLLHGDPSPKVRSTAIVALAAERDDPDDLLAFLRALLESSDPEERIAVARALPHLPGAVAAPIAADAIEHADAPVASALAQALAQESTLSREWSPTLIALLARREARPHARAALLGLGEAGLSALEQALEDPRTEPVVRRHLPRSIHRFGSPRAAAILARHLEGAEPAVRFKALRGLGRMRTDDPDLEIPEDALRREVEVALDRALEMLAFRVACVTDAVVRPRRSEAVKLLARLLADEESHAMERVFRALHVLDPGAEFGAIFEALGTGDSERADGLELVQHLVDGDLRESLLAMTSRAPAAEKLARVCRHREGCAANELAEALPSEPPPEPIPPMPELERALDDCVARMRRDPDEVLAELARHAFEAPEAARRAAVAASGNER